MANMEFKLRTHPKALYQTPYFINRSRKEHISVMKICFAIFNIGNLDTLKTNTNKDFNKINSLN